MRQLANVIGSFVRADNMLLRNSKQRHPAVGSQRLGGKGDGQDGEGAYRDQIGCEYRKAEADFHKDVLENCRSLSPKLFDVALTGVHQLSRELVFMSWVY